MKINRFKDTLLSKKTIKILGVIVVIVAIGLLASKLFKTKNPSVASSKVGPFTAKSQELNKEFTFPIRDASNKEISNIKFVLEKAETANEIVVRGQKATAVPGRMFLLVNLKIVNDFNKSIQISTRDYIRLSVNGKDDELLAPDIHNDPVEAQAISTKYTRVGFPVNISDTKFVLQVGEIKENKEKIELNLK